MFDEPAKWCRGHGVKIRFGEGFPIDTPAKPICSTLPLMIILVCGFARINLQTESYVDDGEILRKREQSLVLLRV